MTHTRGTRARTHLSDDDADDVDDVRVGKLLTILHVVGDDVIITRPSLSGGVCVVGREDAGGCAA